MNSERLLQRFLRYVQVETTADPHSREYPSSRGQLELGRILVAELREAGIEDATQDEHGIVVGTIPATIAEATDAIVFFAHLDTSPEASGANVRPQVWRDYSGKDLILPGAGDQAIRVSENPELSALRGKTIITSDGTTLLGADDKSGVAAIMEAAAWLMEHPEAPHGPVRVCFTCDEEIGRGADYVDLKQLDAAAGYTLDGPAADHIDVETFSADLAVVTVRGVNIHPSIAKGRMVNAVRAAAAFVARLPRDTLAPEVTDNRDGFLHPYDMSGGVAETTVRVLLRDFDTERLGDMADMLRHWAAEVQREHRGVKVLVAIERQYRNMADGLRNEPRAVEYAEAALERLGRVPRRSIIRGGTDGSRLTELGLPTPNLSTGEHNPHSPLEWTCLEEMVLAAEWIVAIARQWSSPPRVGQAMGRVGRRLQ